MVEANQPLEKKRPTDAHNAPPEHLHLDLVALVKDAEKTQPISTLPAGKTTEQSVGTGAEKRTYDVHVPKDWDGKTPLPVMYYFNGLRNDGTREPESFTGLSDRADKQGFAVVYMHGSNERTQTYNNGQKAFANSADENSYLNDIHDKLSKQLPLDQNRQGLAGFSEGGSEAYDLAAKNKWVASAQSVEGYMTGYEKQLSHPVSEQNIHALHDSIVPENGTEQECGLANREAQSMLDISKYTGEIYFDPKQLFHSLVCAVESSGNRIEPQRYTVDTYKKADGITGNGQTIRTPDYTSYDFRNPANGAEVKQITLNEGSHAWAGSTDHRGDLKFMHIGVPNEKVSASDQLSEFFMQHKLIQEKE